MKLVEAIWSRRTFFHGWIQLWQRFSAGLRKNVSRYSDLAQAAFVAGITDQIVTFFCLLDKKRAEKFPVAEIGGKDTIGGTGWKWVTDRKMEENIVPRWPPSGKWSGFYAQNGERKYFTMHLSFSSSSNTLHGRCSDHKVQNNTSAS